MSTSRCFACLPVTSKAGSPESRVCATCGGDVDPVKQVAALYTLGKSSPYAAMSEVDCWDEKRNALLYRGTLPGIWHPPCAHWSPSVAHQTHLTHSQGKHHAPFALKVIRASGIGILEHPAGSRLWDAAWKMPRPEPFRQATMSGPERDPWGGWTLEVDQLDFGHHQIKRTWLYMVGIDPSSVHLPPATTPRTPKSGKVRKDKRTESTWLRPVDEGSNKRKRSPPDFALWLVGLAAGAKRPETT